LEDLPEEVFMLLLREVAVEEGEVAVDV